MRRVHPAHPLLAGALALLVVVAGCASDERPTSSTSPGTSGATPSAAALCSDVTGRLVGAVQRYVDVYGQPATGSDPRDATEATDPDGQELQVALRRTTQELTSRGCDREEFQSDFRAELEKLPTRGPVARAVLLRLTASLTATAQPAGQEVTVRPGDDLPARLAAAAPGSVVRLTPGTHRLTAPLALLEGVTLQGAGRQQTRLESTAADVGLLVVTGDRVELRDLALQHRGEKTGDLVVGGSKAAIVLTRVRVRGAREGPDGSGGNGVLMTTHRGPGPDGDTTLEMTDAELSDNAAAGVLLTGHHVASIRRSRFVGNAECGVCFADATSGAVRDSVFVDNQVGAAVLDRAHPALVTNIFEGGSVGVQASGRSRPHVRDAQVSGADRAALIFSDRSRGRVEDARCESVPYGIVVSPDALPLLGDNDCAAARGQ